MTVMIISHAMEVVSVCVLRTASLLWQPKPGVWTLTVVCKATYRLAPGVAELADPQEEPNDTERHLDGDPQRSLYAPSDVVPFKPRADVTLVGHAFAPRKEPVRSIVVRLKVGSIDKSIEVVADAAWSPEGAPRGGPPFVKMPLRYERAAAGMENPVGVRSNAPPDAFETTPSPNLLPPGRTAKNLSGPIQPIGFGPVAKTWPERARKLPRHAAEALQDAPRGHPMPEGIDPSYFNAAPRDQQVDALRADEPIVLENLHPDHPVLVTKLPGVHPTAVVERPGVAPVELAVRADTLWLDTDRGICTLTWRGQLRLEHPNQPGRVVISTQQSASPHARPDFDPSGVNVANKSSDPVAQFSRPGESTLRTTTSRGPALPFVKRTDDSPSLAVAPLKSAAPPSPPNPPGSTDTQILTGSAISLMTLPFTGAAKAGAPPPSMEPIPPPSASNEPALSRPASSAIHPGLVTNREAPTVTPPPLMRSPSLAEIDIAGSPTSANPSSPWASSLNRATEPAPPVSPLRSAEPAGNALPLSHASKGAIMGGLVAAASTAPSAGTDRRPRVASVAALKNVPPGSALDASNAAADPQPGDGPAGSTARAQPRTVLELLWYDPTAPEAARRQVQWKELLSKLRARDPDADATLTPVRQKEARERLELTRILTAGNPINAEGVAKAIASAVEDDGAFVPPLVLLSGELEIVFDELETLRATVASAMPLASSDKKLKETLDAATEALSAPWIQTASDVIEALLAQVKDAFAQAQRSLPPHYLETHAQRILLGHRQYQRRAVLAGDPWIRSLFTAAGASYSIPTYLPSTGGQALPMFQRFSARVIAEARVQLDQYESHPNALRVLAIGRILPPLDPR